MLYKFRVGVIIITRGRKRSLEKCVEALAPSADSELVVIANGRNDETFEYLKRLMNGRGNIKCLFFEKKLSKSEARNTGIRNSNSEIIYFLDDDSYPGSGNLEFLKNKFEAHPEAGVIGGPNITPPGSGMFERVAGYAFSETFTAWKMNERFSPGREEKFCDDASVTLCNLAFRKTLFDRENIYFDGRLHYNEENLLLEQYIGRGYKILYCPELLVYHSRRKNLAALAGQIFSSGEGRAVMTKITGESLRPVYILPFLFVIYLLSMTFCRRGLYAAPLIAYLSASVLNAASITFKYREKAAAFPLLVILPLIAHASYGAGFAAGMVKKNDG